MKRNKVKDELAHFRFDHHIEECKTLIEKIRNEISAMKERQKKDLQSWSWAANACHMREGLQNVFDLIKDV